MKNARFAQRPSHFRKFAFSNLRRFLGGTLGAEFTAGTFRGPLAPIRRRPLCVEKLEDRVVLDASGGEMDPDFIEGFADPIYPLSETYLTSGSGTFEYTKEDTGPNGAYYLRFGQSADGQSTQTKIGSFSGGQLNSGDNYIASFWFKETGGVRPFEFSLSNNGVNWITIDTITPETDDRYFKYVLDLDQAERDHDLTGGTIYYKIEHFGNEADDSLSVGRLSIVNTSENDGLLRVVGISTPSNTNTLTGFQILFSDDIVESTFTAADVTVTGPDGQVIALAGDPVSLGSPRYFRIEFADPQTALGTYTVAIHPLIKSVRGTPLNQDGDGLAGEESDTFTSVIERTTPPTGTDADGPSVVSVQLASTTPGTVEGFNVTFSEEIDPLSVAAFPFTLIGRASDISISLTAQDTGDHRTFFAELPSPLALGDSYSLTVPAGIRDLAGNSLLVDNIPSHFRHEFELESTGFVSLPSIQTFTDVELASLGAWTFSSSDPLASIGIVSSDSQQGGVNRELRIQGSPDLLQWRGVSFRVDRSGNLGGDNVLLQFDERDFSSHGFWPFDCVETTAVGLRWQRQAWRTRRQPIRNSAMTSTVCWRLPVSPPNRLSISRSWYKHPAPALANSATSFLTISTSALNTSFLLKL
ncbi:MAG: Ig-like domain-containing protein [Planctomycetota bacterium]